MPSPKIQSYRPRFIEAGGGSHLLIVQYSTAVQGLTEAIQYQPDDLWAHFNLGCAHHRSQNFELALDEFNWVIARDPAQAQAQFNRGLVYAQIGEREHAISALKQSLLDAQTDELAHHARQLIQALKQEKPVLTATG